jgi:perosamine synthetase
MITRSLPTGGHPIHLRTILQSFSHGNEEKNSFEKCFGAQKVYWTHSGTSALTLCLKSLVHDENKKEVILPAYTCPSLLASIIKADLKPVLCDLNPANFQLDANQLTAKLGAKTLAVIAVHLFGIPENILRISELVHQNGTVVIEDAAQAFGNKILLNNFSLTTHHLSLNTSTYLGSFGDFGIFSFGRGKPLSFLAGGGLVLNNSKFQEDVQTQYALISRFAFLPTPLSYLINLLVYSIFYHPRFYWIPQNIPWLKLGETVFSLDFEIRGLNPQVLRTGQRLFLNLQQIRKRRNNLAATYMEKLERWNEEFVYLPEKNSDHVSLLRFPLILKSKEKRDRILTELRHKGLGATGMYPVPLNEQEGIPNHLFKGELYPNAKRHSERILTLPLHEYVTMNDIDLICGVIEKHLAG